MMTNSRRLLSILVILLVTLVGLTLRVRAAAMLPIDYDEDDYLLAAQHYAEALRGNNWNAVINYNYNYEHPPLTKLAYGIAILPLPPSPAIPELAVNGPAAHTLPEPHFDYARYTSLTFGALEVLALAIFDPLAGLFLGIHTWQIKYTSQIMLEPLPALTSALAVLFYVQGRRPGQSQWNVWLALSGAALGLTAASKYVYCLAGVAIAIDWLWSTRPNLKPQISNYKLPDPILAWGLISLAVFFAADPYLWNDPVSRLKESLLYHGSYAQSQHVKEAGFPTWQPFVWLSGPVPWHPGVFLLPLDLYIGIFAVFGLRRLWRDPQRRVFVIWLILALAFLLWWTTKWPQYILILTVPLTVAASAGFAERVWEPLIGWARSKASGGVRAATKPRESYPDSRRAIPWLLPGLIGLLLLTAFPLIYQAAMSLTDFNQLSIRDGINGGVWREVWLGLTLQKPAQPIDLFSSAPRSSTEVHFAGPGVLLQFFFGLGSDVLFFNVMWAALSVMLQAMLGVGVALVLNRPGVRFRNWWRAVFILPWAIPEFVGALIWLRIFDPQYGWLTQSLPSDVVLPLFFEDQNYALLCLLIGATWCGFPLILLAATAGLKLVPLDVYDAAAMDGASAWAQFRHVTWPLLLPLLAPAIIIRSIFAFNQFYLFWVMQSRFPLMSLATLSYFVFSYGGGQYAVSAAINIFTVVVLVILILWFDRVSRAGEGVTYA